jgi:hypothetical protein
MMDDQWQKPDHAGDGGADEYSWADRDGLAGNYSDTNQKTDPDYQDTEPSENPDRDQLTLYDLKEMLLDLSSRLKKFEITR